MIKSVQEAKHRKLGISGGLVYADIMSFQKLSSLRQGDLGGLVYADTVSVQKLSSLQEARRNCKAARANSVGMLRCERDTHVDAADL